MTTKVTITCDKACNPDKAIAVATVSNGSPSEPKRILTAGQSVELYVHSGMSIAVVEVKHAPESPDQWADK